MALKLTNLQEKVKIEVNTQFNSIAMIFAAWKIKLIVIFFVPALKFKQIRKIQ